MKVEIWSDVVCPFCYIGKRKFEKALGEFAHRAEVQVEWKSFELTPDFVPVPGESIHASLAKKKGVPEAEGRRMNDYMTQAAKEVGLSYQFDKAIPANTFLAHQLIHFGAQHGRQDATKERLFAAYYLEGRDLNSVDTLTNLAAEIGLDAEAARQALLAGTYAEAVRRDEYEAQQIQVRGVPFFVFDDKYAVSGAQPSEVFAQVLNTVWQEAHPKAQPAVLADGPACGPDGCD
ncbi:DsbA family oxidoreductase [Hymenobacter baengnokdamensis]|uniref:DsbA family oxidoreductase n=1 Tax=Hymenobacter baengnokdamensis TaxID=2615203 RepID=UPI001246AC34|nr:DsbA family oxidoreductase [Hymenobacter baengnokdamensis]